MTYGNGNDAYLTRKLRNKALLDEFKCTYCSPHGGENHSNRNGRYVDGAFRPAKSKDRK